MAIDWGTCDACRGSTITDVRQVATCTSCRKRIRRQPSAKPWPPCPQCGAPVAGEQLSAACASCGARRTRAPAQLEPVPSRVAVPAPSVPPPPGGRFGSKRWHKAALVVLALFALLIVIAAVNAPPAPETPGDGSTAAPTVTGAPRLFPGRVDAQPQDQERQIGQPVTLRGIEANVQSAGFRRSLNSFQEDGYIVAQIALTNVGSKAAPYSPTEWRIQTPDGQVKDITFMTDGQLDSGDLVAGGKASGSVAFEIGDKKGDFYLLWKADAFHADRGVWKVTV